MALIQIMAFAMCVVYIGYKLDEEFIDVVPAAVSLLMLILYGLSFVNGLLWTDGIAIAVCLGILSYGIWQQMCEHKGNSILQYLFKEIQKPSVLMTVLLLVLVPLLTSGKAVSWWDDYNFWATDVKSIYFLNGFASKYQNVAAEFGDYPPGTQMIKWWFLHMSPKVWKEGLIFSGYYFMNLCYLVPLLASLKKWNGKWSFLLAPVMAAAIWLFPSCVEAFGYDGSCADLTMAVVYGAFLYAVVDREEHTSLFYYGRQVLLLMVLILCKNVGFLWVGFAILFMLLYHIAVDKKFEKRGLLAVIVLPILTEGSWLLFCLRNRRVAKLTGTALHMATGSAQIPELQKEMLKVYVEAFVRYPLHRYSTIMIDLSPLALFLLLPVFVWILYKCKKIDRKQKRFLLCFIPINGLTFYAINLISHVTIFATESQYLEPFAMVSSIERYGAPFTIGMLYLTAYLTMRGKKEDAAYLEMQEHSGNATCQSEEKSFGAYAGILACVCFVLLTADYEIAYTGLCGYREKKEQTLSERDGIIDEKATAFLVQTTETLKEGGRVLYLRDVSDISWVRNTYLGYEASPVSVMYGNVDASYMTSEDIARMIRESHAGYLYVDEIENGVQIFSDLSQEELRYGEIYEIIEDGSGLIQIQEYKLEEN